MTLDLEEQKVIIKAPEDLEAKYLEMIGNIDVLHPSIKVHNITFRISTLTFHYQEKVDELGLFEYGAGADLSYLILKEKDTTEFDKIYYGFWYLISITTMTQII